MNLPDTIRQEIEEVLGMSEKACMDKPEGIERSLCQLTYLAEKHPELARIGTKILCRVALVTEKHPELIKLVRKLI